ncbi:sporulation histidine kinase inhibitor Sda [Bacillus solitudinis]|uniref:sporulation histidine kinase inhibitor Sda n=1 Tax=Bacillus solitudinis TaxID=2014074 RepID=UPI001D0D6244|nr:sporulation histidine kinase inhibitor Sda [Bacillus solitudinis]
MMRSSFKYLTDNLLIDTYQKALEFKLDECFIELIADELKFRNLMDRLKQPVTIQENVNTPQ